MASAEAAINRKRKRQVKHLSFPSHFLFAIFNLLSEDLLFLLRSLFENISVIITSKILTNFHWSTGFEIKQYSYQNFHYRVQKTDYLYLSPYLSPTHPPPKKKIPLSRIQHTSLLLEKGWKKAPVQLANLSKRGSGQSVFQWVLRNFSSNSPNWLLYSEKCKE